MSIEKAIEIIVERPFRIVTISKCEILRDSIKYLGRMVDRHGVRPDPEAVEAVLTWKPPRTDTQLMSFLGFANYYREFIKGYADKVYPMQKLMRNKGKKFEWSDEALWLLRT